MSDPTENAINAKHAWQERAWQKAMIPLSITNAQIEAGRGACAGYPWAISDAMLGDIYLAMSKAETTTDDPMRELQRLGQEFDASPTVNIGWGLVETVAKAIWETPVEGPTGAIDWVRVWPPEYPDVRDEFMRQAQAAIQASGLIVLQNRVRAYERALAWAEDHDPQLIEMIEARVNALIREED